MLGVFLREGFKACWESSLVKDSSMLGVFLSDGFKACWSLLFETIEAATVSFS